MPGTPESAYAARPRRESVAHQAAMNLSTIIAGTWRLPEWGKTAGEVADWIRRALDLGVDTFDLADIYGGYTVEEAFGDALCSIRAGSSSSPSATSAS